MAKATVWLYKSEFTGECHRRINWFSLLARFDIPEITRPDVEGIVIEIEDVRIVPDPTRSAIGKK